MPWRRAKFKLNSWSRDIPLTARNIHKPSRSQFTTKTNSLTSPNGTKDLLLKLLEHWDEPQTPRNNNRHGSISSEWSERDSLGQRTISSINPFLKSQSTNKKIAVSFGEKYEFSFVISRRSDSGWKNWLFKAWLFNCIEGEKLFERVIDDDFISTEKSCTIFIRQICEGVDFIHKQSILHLDMKPENTLCLTKTDNRIKIIDFGLARKFDPAKKLQVLFGTPEFVAPEVVNFDI
ncbi:hypothetical protein JTB14_016309 [Gonioctena quinquepunctata]|nr:hypothetical protein JTB14_016309 [Gonioctena quinquepunctata]